MERGSRDLSGSAEDSGSTNGGGDEKNKDIDSSHRVNEAEDDISSDTLSLSEGDSHSDESAMEEELSDSESEETISASRTSPRGAKDSGSNRKKTSCISYSDTSYLNSLSRQERWRIEGEMIKGRKPGKSKSVTQQSINT